MPRRLSYACLAALPALCQTDEVFRRELERTRPDYVVYQPRSLDGRSLDTGNEHFLVFDGPDGSLMAVWTQSSYEGAGNHRSIFSRSTDEGVTWSAPLRLAGPTRKEEGYIASWGFPLVSRKGRIYLAGLSVPAAE